MEKLKVSDLWNLNNLDDFNTIFGVIADDYSDLVGDFINTDNYNHLDVDYLIGFSADKYLSPLAVKLYEFNLKSIDETTNAIVPIIINRFGTKWKKLWDALNTSYKPLENYSMIETRTPDLSTSRTGTETTKTSGENGIQGFNSVEYNPSTNNDGENELTLNTTESHTGTETLERNGNIGVTTSQQMLESEFEVRKYDFYKEIYKDIDSILCLRIY